jgi:hypothetical protein
MSRQGPARPGRVSGPRVGTLAPRPALLHARPHLPRSHPRPPGWPVEGTHARINGFGELRRCTYKRMIIVEFYRYSSSPLP